MYSDAPTPVVSTPSPPSVPMAQSPLESSSSTIIIMLLLFALVLSMLGVDMFMIASNTSKDIRRIVGPAISSVFSGIGYSTGTIIDETSDSAADIAKTGIDIAEGTAQSVGDLLIKASGKEHRSLDDSVNNNKQRIRSDPQPSNGDGSIHKPISSSKSGWCLVGEYEGKRGCVSVQDSDKCLSGQVFPSQQICMNPTQSANATQAGDINQALR